MACPLLWRGGDQPQFVVTEKLLVGQEVSQMLRGKKVIVIGERDGIPSPAIEECLKTVDVKPVFSLTQCYV